MLDTYPILDLLAFPFIWVFGIVLIFVGYGFPQESDKPSGSGGVDRAPGMSEDKNSIFRDGPFGGDGGGSGGDGGG